jgi:hypothetical protein
MSRLILVLCAVVLLAGCGGSTKPSFPTVGAARTFALVDFKPTAPAIAGKPTAVSFVIRQPDGTPLTSFRRGPGPHTGVHVIFVRRDLAAIVHVHPPIASDGTIKETITFTKPGPYRLVVDVYPNTTGPQRNFQLFGSLSVAGAYRPSALPAFAPSVVVDGYRFTMKDRPSLHAIQAAFLTIDVTDPQGKPVRFTPWFGALAHAIFFHQSSLYYFHTHICAPNAPNCGSLAGVPLTKVTGHATPGKLTIGVLLAVPGTWRLFLQMKAGGKIITAPYTLDVK